ALIADKVSRFVLLSALFVLSALFNMVLLWGQGYMALIIAAAMLGVCSGTVTHTFYALLADLFGQASFGTVRGLSLLVSSLVAFGAVRFGGEVFDRTGSYNGAFITFIAIALAAAAVMLMTGHAQRRAAAPGQLDSAIS